MNGKNTSTEKKKSKTWVYLPWLSSFLEIWKLLFHSLQKAAENSNRTFWVNGNKAPKVFG